MCVLGWRVHCVIHGDFYRFGKVSPPISVHNQRGVADTGGGNTASLYLTFLTPPSPSTLHPLICHLPPRLAEEEEQGHFSSVLRDVQRDFVVQFGG